MAANEMSRQQVVDVLHRLGHGHLVEEAERVLPDPVDYDELGEWAQRHGVTRDELVSRMGGSP